MLEYGFMTFGFVGLLRRKYPRIDGYKCLIIGAIVATLITQIASWVGELHPYVQVVLHATRIAGIALGFGELLHYQARRAPAALHGAAAQGPKFLSRDEAMAHLGELEDKARAVKALLDTPTRSAFRDSGNTTGALPGKLTKEELDSLPAAIVEAIPTAAIEEEKTTKP